MERHGSDAKGVDAVERALTLLGAFDTMGKRALTLHELAQSTRFYKSTILRLAVSLERFGYLRRGDDGRYQLGPACARLAAAHGYAGNQGELLQRAVTFLAHASGETASFYVREGNARVCVIRENSTHAVRHHVELGQRLPLKLGAASLALLAFSGVKGARFDEIRRTGYAVSIGERLPDAAAVSAPVFDAQDRLLGALTISGLTTRFTKKAVAKFRKLLGQAIQEVERDLGRRVV